MTVRFEAAKAKGARTKATGICRLEVMAEMLEITLSRKVSELLKVSSENGTMWTDTEDVICWIQGQSRRSNRISGIHQECNPRR